MHSCRPSFAGPSAAADARSLHPHTAAAARAAWPAEDSTAPSCEQSLPANDTAAGSASPPADAGQRALEELLTPERAVDPDPTQPQASRSPQPGCGMGGLRPPCSRKRLWDGSKAAEVAPAAAPDVAESAPAAAGISHGELQLGQGCNSAAAMPAAVLQSHPSDGNERPAKVRRQDACSGVAAPADLGSPGGIAAAQQLDWRRLYAAENGWATPHFRCHRLPSRSQAGRCTSFCYLVAAATLHWQGQRCTTQE